MNFPINMSISRMTSPRYLLLTGLLLLLGTLPMQARAELTLDNIEFSTLPGEKVQLKLTLSGPAPEPSSFTIDDPASISVDLPNTKLNLEQRSMLIDTGMARSVRAVEAGQRTRVVLNLARIVPYQLRSDGNAIYLSLQNGGTAQAPRTIVGSAEASTQSTLGKVDSIDFRRGEDGEGRVIVTFSDPNSMIDTVEKGDRIVVDFIGLDLPEELRRRLDVVDFATPVSTIDSMPTDSGTRMVIRASGDYEHLAYQAGNNFTLEVKPVTPEAKAELDKQRRGFTGKKLSLNFQNIEVRAVLQLIADFTQLNIVASDSVQGNITLRLKNVPWDQALDIILKSKGLGMRMTGDVVLIAPNEEIAAREKMELEALKQKEELAPLRTEFFQVNYAKAAEIAELLKGEQNSLLSERGNVTLDERTNTLMILDTDDKLADIRRLIKRLDVPVRQVLIESRIVIANDDFTNSLGVRAGVTNVRDNGGNGIIGVSGSTAATDTMVSSALDNAANTGSYYPVAIPAGDGGVADRLNVDLPVVSPAGQIALAVLGSDYLVDLELSALQQEGRGEVISNPRVITANQHKALIEQGVEIPYWTESPTGGTTISFKKAVLSLNVTPQITPDDRVVMDLQVNKDSVGEILNGIPSINTREVNTQVLVDNGDTVVLGGIYEQARSENNTKVPLLGDIPFLGALFRSTTKVDDKAELLIFVTPRILKQGARVELD